MKNTLLLSLYCVVVSHNLLGQSDTYYKKPDSLQIKNRFDYERGVPSRQFIKVGVALPILRQNSFRGFYQTIAFNALIEQKVGRFSFLAGLQANVGFASQSRLFQLEMPLDLRYYFPIGKRMRQCGDNCDFYRYYVGVRTQNTIYSRLKYERALGLGYFDIDRYERGQILSQAVNNGLINESFNFFEYGYLQVGGQWKLFERCFLDANAVIPVSSLTYNKWDYTLSSPAFATITFGYRLGNK